VKTSMSSPKETWFWRAVWLPAYVLTVLLTLRLVYEQTWLSWQRGPQMIGFSLAHSGWALPLFAGTLFMVVWSVAATVLLIAQRLRHGAVSPGIRKRWLMAIATLCITFLPERAWRYPLLRIAGHGDNASEWLTHAAATGDLPTVRLLLQGGVPVDARTEDNSTALIGASVEGKLEIVDTLLRRGADVNAKTRFGTTAILAAVEMGHRDVADFLMRHGASIPCSGSIVADMEAYLRNRPEIAIIIARDDSLRRRSATRSDSTFDAWVSAAGMKRPPCPSLTAAPPDR
jgi:hypothetical protein